MQVLTPSHYASGCHTDDGDMSGSCIAPTRTDLRPRSQTLQPKNDLQCARDPSPPQSTLYAPRKKPRPPNPGRLTLAESAGLLEVLLEHVHQLAGLQGYLSLSALGCGVPRISRAFGLGGLGPEFRNFGVCLPQTFRDASSRALGVRAFLALRPLNPSPKQPPPGQSPVLGSGPRLGRSGAVRRPPLQLRGWL